MSVELIKDFNDATTWQEALAAIKDEGYFEILFDTEAEATKYNGMLEDLLDDGGREEAIAKGVNEIRDLFGDFETVTEIKAAVTMQIEVEHAKQVFIDTINHARSAEDLKAVLKSQLDIVNQHRQDLIDDWSDETDPAIIARVAELKADTYTIWLEQLTAQLNNDADGAFLTALSAKFVEARANGNYFGVYTLLKNLDKAADEASPAGSPDDLLANGSQIYLTKADEAGEITFTAATQSSWTDPDVLKVGTGLPSSIKIAFDGPDFAGASYGRTTGAISEGGVVRFVNPTANTANFFKMAAGDGKTPGADLEVGDQVSFVYVRNADNTYNIYVDANGNGNLDAGDVGFKVDAAIVDNVGIEPIGSDHFVDSFAPAAPTVTLIDDTGASDGITNNGALMVTAENGATVEYSIDGGEIWTETFAAVEGENTVRVRQTDAAGNVSATTTFTFTLDTAAPEVTSPLTLAENADGRTTPVEVAALSTEESATFTITGGEDQALFDIVDGKLVYVGGALDFESETDQKIFVLTITAEDAAGNVEEHEVTINLTNVNEAPVAATSGNSASGNEDTIITGTIPSGSDVDAGDSLKYELVAAVAGLTLNANGTFSYAPAANSNGVVEFQYRVVDEDGAKSAPQTFKLTVNAVNDTPWDIALSANQIVENSKTGTSVGKLTGFDVDGDALTFTLLDDAGGRFTFDSKTNELKVANDYALDFEQATSHTVKVQVKDSAGTTYEEAFTIGVMDDTSESVTGTGGKDVLVGGAGKDVFDGGLGNDKLAGGLGNDKLTGGKGKDVFVFDSKLGTSSTDRKVNFDKITDFSVKDDSLYLDNAVFKKLGSGTEAKPKQLSKSFFTIGSKANDKNDYLIYNDKTGVLSYDADGSGKGKAIEFAQLSKKLAMTNKDFFVI
jgi:Ca2+-binding RTX toxin-like protein